ncbi:Enoyl-(Acyl carrier protein) reductase [Lachnospiraceae bacterium XBB1006]|nr:Enoyl-(Acyl carrier protein) reductase [Lachnospiraceae bacterium XBB1006]
MMDFEFIGKTLFLTGGRGGIGSVIKDRFISAGATVIAPTSDELDLSKAESIAKYLKENDLLADMVIHAAGINELAGIIDVTEEVLYNVFQVNVFSFVELLKGLVPKMKEQSYGRIVGISSLYGIVSKEKRIPYSASKHAMTGLIKSTALELAENNILINGVAPGYVMTKMTEKNLSKEELDNLKNEIPTHRLQEAIEIADLCLFLCSSMNQSITGQIIPVDGGFTCR